MIPHEELTSNAYDDIRFQRIIIEEMGELLPAKLFAECDLTHARSLLEIGCGAGAWLRAIARLYPDLQCIGIDQDEFQVKAANALAQRDHLAQVAFLTTDMNDVSPVLFSPGSFDLVHLSLLGRYILTVNYPGLCCKNAGVVVSSASIQQHQRSSLYESAESVQMASLRSRDHSPVRALVPAVCTQLP